MAKQGSFTFDGEPVFSARPGVISTCCGLLDPNHTPGETIIGRNAGCGPAPIMVNLKSQKTWSFGRERGASGASSERSSGGTANRGAMPGALASTAPPLGAYAPSRDPHCKLSLGMSGRNLLNHNNPCPIGNITSPLFGPANQIARQPE